VDTTGRVIVLTTSLEHAELKRDQIHAFGPDPNSSKECVVSMSPDRLFHSLRLCILRIPGQQASIFHGRGLNGAKAKRYSSRAARVTIIAVAHTHEMQPMSVRCPAPHQANSADPDDLAESDEIAKVRALLRASLNKSTHPIVRAGLTQCLNEFAHLTPCV
jgi:hypothetical protein